MPIVLQIGSMSKDFSTVKVNSTYHTVENSFGGEIHIGSRRQCPICKKARDKLREQKAAENRAKKLKPYQRNWPECKVCGVKVRPDNTTGMCVYCLNKDRARKKEEAAPKCVSCGTRLRRKNKSGLCLKCFNAKQKKASNPKYMSVSFIKR